ncbi:uracil DNA N-glycosylase Thp1 [Coniothyrium glycines]
MRNSRLNDSLKMPTTRSRAAGSSSAISLSRVVSSRDRSSSPTVPNLLQPSAKFRASLTKFEYNSSSFLMDKATKSIPQPSRKRSQLHDTVSTNPPQGAVSTQPKKKRKPSKYADPAKYAHLKPLVDILEPNLIGVFVGTNPGVSTATQGHAYAHPSNLFWKLLHSSGLTDQRLKPEQDRSLPYLYCLGNTNIVERPSKDAAELSREEMVAGTARLDEKFLKYKPEAVCIVGKGIWEAIWRYRYGRGMKKDEFKFGWQDEKDNMGRSADGEEEADAWGNVWKGSKVFVTTSTSGLAASLKPAEKEAIWKPFGEWVQQRRQERNIVPQEAEMKHADEES